MTDGSQSRQDTDIQTADVLTPKDVCRVGCWNVRTLYQTGRLAQVINEMEMNNIEMLGVCETRWTGSGSRKLATGQTIVYSGRKDDHHSRGVGLISNRRLSRCMIGWKPVSDRILTARFHSKYAKLTVVICYSPTEDSEEEEKEVFYDQLQKTVEDTPVHDVLLLLGDFNAKVGTNNEGKERVMGKQGCGIINGNGSRLVNFCEDNNLVIGGTIFQHKNIHKLTWTSPDGQTRNQIDHALINKRWRGTLQDVRVLRGADAGSDHSLVLIKLKLKLRKAKKAEQRSPLLDVQKLKDPVIKRQFQLEVRNRFEVLRDQHQLDLDDFNEVMVDVGQETLGWRRRKKEEWISTKTWDMIGKRKAIKNKLLSAKSPRLKENLKRTYSEQDKEVKKSAKKDKKDYIERLATDAEEAAARQDMGTLYRISKSLSGGFKNAETPVRKQDGELTSCTEEELTCWKEHFERVLNRDDPSVEAEISPADEVLDIDIGKPTLEEVTKAIKTLKNGKSPGCDQVQAEMLKAEEVVTPRVLTDILQNIWETETAPNQWKIGLIVKLPKKGDLTDTNNWRGIMLLSITSKVLCRVILNRITDMVDPLLRNEQAGFRRGRSCADHIFTLRQIMEQSNEWNATVYANFIDFAKAFDSIHRPAMWKIMEHYGIPNKIISIIKMLYQDFQARVICGTNVTDSFPLQTGVRQGCLLSPLLFVLCIDWVMKKTNNQNNRGLLWTFEKSLEDLDFADDIALLAQSFQHIQGKTTDLANYGSQIGLNINTGKTKTMKVNNKIEREVTIGNDVVEEVSEFVYLGSKITADGDSTSDVESRIAKARAAFASLRNIWKSSAISIKTKIRIFKSNIIGVLLYGAESWKVTKVIVHRLDVFQTKCLRRILKVFWPNTISNKDLYRRTSTSPISEMIKMRRWKWIGHVHRMGATSIPKIAMRWTPAGKRNRGRPKETWRRSVEKEMKERGWTWGRIQNMAADRQRWRSSVKALCASQHEED